jgi:hypothetical protein
LKRPTEEQLGDNYRGLLSGAMDTRPSTVSNRPNVVMKQLTVIATVFLPLSFPTGFFGQNFAWMGGVSRVREHSLAGHRPRGAGGRGPDGLLRATGVVGRPLGLTAVLKHSPRLGLSALLVPGPSALPDPALDRQGGGGSRSIGAAESERGMT